MKALGLLCAQNGLHPVQHPRRLLQALQSPQRAGVEVAEVHAGQQPFAHGGELQDLLQVPQLIELAHGLRAEEDISVPLVVAPAAEHTEGRLGGGQSLFPGALLQGPRVDHHPAGPHPPGRPAGGQHIARRLLLALRVGVGGIDEVGGVEGQGDPRQGGLPADLPGGVLPQVHPLAALVLIGVQSLFLQPQGHVPGLFKPLQAEVIRVSRRSK